MLETLEILTDAAAATMPPPAPPKRRRQRDVRPALADWLKIQPVSVARHAAALRPFTREEFGNAAAAPTEGHLQAANALISKLREGLLKLAAEVTQTSATAQQQPGDVQLGRMLAAKDRAQGWVQAIEKIWDFYFELFGQRQSRFADWLLSCDRIALDCYQQAFLHVGEAKSIPAPPPFVYMRTGMSPATFRRAVPLKRLGLQPNPFPLIELPYHRLTNPWTLGAILHEVSHNLQNDLGLDQVVPRDIAARLVAHGIPQSVAAVWKRWNRETFADMSGLLLGGPGVVESLMDVVGRSRATTMGYADGAVHPTPYLRTFISCELLRRMGFPRHAEEYRRTWTRLYPDPRRSDIPREILRTFGDAHAIVVDTICFQKYAQLGGKSLAEVMCFGPKEQCIVEEAARRLAAGTDPGVVPERFLIGALRVAMDRGLARPGVLTKNFYSELARR